MKWSITAVVVVACVLAFAQGGRTEKASKKEYSVGGCLRAGSAPNSYMISKREKGAPRPFAIVSSSVDLAPHLGQKVEIKGTLVPAKEAEADPNVPRAIHYMKVKAIETISTTCP